MPILSASQNAESLQDQDHALPERDGARLVTDENGMIVGADPAFETLCSYTARDIHGIHLTELMSFQDGDDVFMAHAILSAGKRSFFDTLRPGLHDVFLGNDIHQPLAFTFDPVTLADGRRFVLIAEATRGSVQNDEQEQLNSEDFAELVGAPSLSAPSVVSTLSPEDTAHFLDMSQEIMVALRPDGYILSANTTFFRTLGCQQDQAIFLPDLINADDRADILSILQRLPYEIESCTSLELRMQGLQGEPLWIGWNLRYDNGLIYATGLDVTDVKTHEETLKWQAQQLSEAQAIARLRHWRWVVGERNIEWSSQLYRIFGVDQESFNPTIETINSMLHRRDLGRLLQAFQRAIIEHNNYDMEFRIFRPSGEVRFIRCEGRCDLDEEGDVIALFGIMQDITEQTLYQRELREAKESSERAYAAKSQFLANMSHELRTPLNAIIGFSEMMQRQLLGPIGTERYLDYITGIRESGEHLLDLISDILDMSKIEAGKYELDLEQLNLAKVIRLATHMMEGRAHEGKISVSVTLEDENLDIIADRRALMQMLLNLLSNAIKFTESGGSVSLETVSRGDIVTIRVRDTGIGIPANKLNCVTRPFEQAASHYTRDHQGSGLGLAITKDLIELHGGTLHIDSTVGVGTTVTIRLPMNAWEHVRAARNAKESA
jgi:two-component system, cell cycle sensor histidine kinase PleC